ncbi:MAG: methylmalonyl Co-A mutase-associated GTPase MeaB [Bradymonadia bacterium]
MTPSDGQVLARDGAFDALMARRPRALARHLRGLDDGVTSAFEMQRRLLALGRSAVTIGITGSPGVGKSSLTDQLIVDYRARDFRVAVIAVDPSSPFTGGAILGDRIRMQRHYGDPDVFIRSVATRGSMGGLSASIRDMVDAVIAVGYEVVIIETVGVGQDEIDIVNLAQTNVVVELPGAGDGVQAIKAGLLEIADIFVVNKADKPGAEQVVKQLGLLMSQGHDVAEGWAPPILKTVALTGEGIEALAHHIESHQQFLTESGQGEARRQAFRTAAIKEALRARINQMVVEVLDSETVGGLSSSPDLPRDVAERVLAQACAKLATDT